MCNLYKLKQSAEEVALFNAVGDPPGNAGDTVHPPTVDRKTERINIHEPWELRSWTQAQGVTEARLRTPVNSVG